MSKPKLSLASLSVNAQPPADHMDKEPIQSNKKGLRPLDD